MPLCRVNFRKLNVDGLNIFYREAGAADAPTILLLHDRQRTPAAISGSA
jgi:hypothetical protein